MLKYFTWAMMPFMEDNLTKTVIEAAYEAGQLTYEEYSALMFALNCG